VFGYDEITRQYHDRYKLPVMHTETNMNAGPGGSEAVDWLWKQWANVLRVRNSGWLKEGPRGAAAAGGAREEPTGPRRVSGVVYNDPTRGVTGEQTRPPPSPPERVGPVGGRVRKAPPPPPTTPPRRGTRPAGHVAAATDARAGERRGTPVRVRTWDAHEPGHRGLPPRYREDRAAGAPPPFRASFSPLPGLNLMAVEAAISTASPVRGLRPWRASRRAASKLPKRFRCVG